MRETVGYGHFVNRFADQLRAAGCLPLSDNIFGKVEIARLFRPVIQIHDRFEDRRARHTDIIARRDDIHLSGADLRHQMIDNFAGSFQRFLISRQIVPGNQTQRGIFTSPDIPLLQLVFRRIISDISVCRLRRHKRFGCILYDPVEFRVLVITIRSDRPLNPFPPELALPTRLLRLVTERLDQMIHILRFHTMFDTISYSSPYITGYFHLFYRRVIDYLRHARRRTCTSQQEGKGFHLEQYHHNIKKLSITETKIES